MPDHRAPKQLLYGELNTKKQPAYKAKLRLEDTLKKTSDKQDFATKTWESLAANRNQWRGLVAFYFQTTEKTGRLTKKNDS